MKSSLRKGNYAGLNIYFLDDLGGDLGYCYFPTNAAKGSDDFIRDGCSVLAASVPGGSSRASTAARLLSTRPATGSVYTTHSRVGATAQVTRWPTRLLSLPRRLVAPLVVTRAPTSPGVTPSTTTWTTHRSEYPHLPKLNIYTKSMK